MTNIPNSAINIQSTFYSCNGLENVSHTGQNV